MMLVLAVLTMDMLFCRLLMLMGAIFMVVLVLLDSLFMLLNMSDTVSEKNIEEFMRKEEWNTPVESNS